MVALVGDPDPGGSLADTHPEIAAEADGWDPSAYRPGSSARLPWQCSTCGHAWTSTVFRRTQGRRLPGTAHGPSDDGRRSSDCSPPRSSDLQAAANGRGAVPDHGERRARAATSSSSRAAWAALRALQKSAPDPADDTDLRAEAERLRTQWQADLERWRAHEGSSWIPYCEGGVAGLTEFLREP